MQVDLERGGELERIGVLVAGRLERYQAPTKHLIALFLLENV